MKTILRFENDPWKHKTLPRAASGRQIAGGLKSEQEPQTRLIRTLPIRIQEVSGLRGS